MQRLARLSTRYTHVPAPLTSAAQVAADKVRVSHFSDPSSLTCNLWFHPWRVISICFTVRIFVRRGLLCELMVWMMFVDSVCSVMFGRVFRV